jgi:hypothetical protein
MRDERSAEDFYEVPPREVMLVGGPSDGRRFTVPDGFGDTIVMPDPLTPGEIMDFAGPVALAVQTTVYRLSGIADDGLRVFRAARRGR